MKKNMRRNTPIIKKQNKPKIINYLEVLLLSVPPLKLSKRMSTSSTNAAVARYSLKHPPV
jgi:hypothetical protein